MPTGSPSLQDDSRRDVAPWSSASATWAVNFAAAFATLAILKVVVLLHGAFGNADDAVTRELGHAPLLFGYDAIGAAVVAAIAALVALAVSRRHRPRRAKATSLAVQGVHATVAALSALSLVELGGPLTKAGIDSFVYQMHEAGAAMGASLADHVTLRSVAILFGAPVLTIVVLRYASRAWRRAHPSLVGSIAAVIAGLTLATVALLPKLQDGTQRDGRNRRIRLFTNELEHSPLLDLAWSYAKPAVRGIAPGSRSVDLSLDLASIEHPGQKLETPLARAKRRRTNVLVVVLESVSHHYATAPSSAMPYLRSLKGGPGSVWLEHHYTTWCLTTKALFSILCSELPYPTYEPITMVNPAVPCRSLSESLSDAGYFTALVTSQDLGWDRQSRFYRHRNLDLTWDMSNMPKHDTAWRAAWGLDDRVTVDNVLGLVKEKRHEPFFVMAHLVAGHHPYHAMPDHKANKLPNREARYLRAIRVADDRLRDLMNGLDAAGLSDDTLVAIVSDHGEGVAGQRLGRNVYEVGVRVPAVLLGPQLAGIRETLVATTSHLDLAPTLLGLLDLPVPCTMRGRDLSRPTVERVAPVGGRPPRFQLGVVDGRWKFILEDGTNDALYDLTTDPGETKNLLADHAERARAYRDRVVALRDGAERLLEGYAGHLTPDGCVP